MLVQNQVGPIATAQSISSGLAAPARAGNLGDTIVSELHGRFYEQVYRGNVYSGGVTLTALLAANATATGLTATAQPLLGLYNPSASTVNLVVLQASFQLAPNTFTTPVSPGGLVWLTSVNNNAVSTGTVGTNRKTLATGAGQGKYFAISTALTGLTNNLAIIEGADFTFAGNVAYGTVAATALYPSVGGVQNVDGSFIVPPGAVLALMNTVSSTTYSGYGRILWEEVPL